MKNTVLVTLIAMATIALCQPVLADHRHPPGHEAHERERTVVIHEHFHEHDYHRRSPAPHYGHEHYRHEQGAAENMILGGIMGGLIGSRLAHDHDRLTFTLLGTLVGASIGHDMAYRRDHRGHRHHRLCRHRRPPY